MSDTEVDELPKLTTVQLRELAVKEFQNGTSYGDALKKLQKKYDVRPRTFDRRWKEAKEAYGAVRDSLQKAIREELREEALTAPRATVMSKEERKIIASKIAAGTARKVGGEIIVPTDTERIRALDYLSKIDGDYAAVKSRQVDEKGNTVKIPTSIVVEVITHPSQIDPDDEEDDEDEAFFDEETITNS